MKVLWICTVELVRMWSSNVVVFSQIRVGLKLTEETRMKICYQHSPR